MFGNITIKGDLKKYLSNRMHNGVNANKNSRKHLSISSDTSIASIEGIEFKKDEDNNGENIEDLYASSKISIKKRFEEFMTSNDFSVKSAFNNEWSSYEEYNVRSFYNVENINSDSWYATNPKVANVIEKFEKVANAIRRFDNKNVSKQRTPSLSNNHGIPREDQENSDGEKDEGDLYNPSSYHPVENEIDYLHIKGKIYPIVKEYFHQCISGNRYSGDKSSVSDDAYTFDESHSYEDIDELMCKIALHSPKFDPKIYLSIVHSDSSLDELLRGKEFIECKYKESLLSYNNMLKDNFSCYVKAKNTIENVYSDMKTTVYSKEGCGLAKANRVVAQLLDTMKTTFEPLMSIRKKEEILAKKYGIILNYSFFFFLPRSLKDYVDNERFELIIRDYVKAKVFITTMKREYMDCWFQQEVNGIKTNNAGLMKSEVKIPGAQDLDGSSYMDSFNSGIKSMEEYSNMTFNDIRIEKRTIREYMKFFQKYGEE